MTGEARLRSSMRMVWGMKEQMARLLSDERTDSCMIT